MLNWRTLGAAPFAESFLVVPFSRLASVKVHSLRAPYVPVPASLLSEIQFPARLLSLFF